MMQKKQTFCIVEGRLKMWIKLWVVNTAIYGEKYGVPLILLSSVLSLRKALYPLILCE